MKKVIVLSLASLLILAVVLMWSSYSKPVVAVESNSQSRLFYGMGVFKNVSTEMLGSLATIGQETVVALHPAWNITFGDPWQLAGYGWIVNLTVPATTYYSSTDLWWANFVGWTNSTVTMTVDGNGWLFLNSTGDVDCYTSNNNTGSYWISPSPDAGAKAADPGVFPFPGPDGVPGTADDGFGDGTLDPRGSSILYMKTNITAYVANAGTGWQWQFFFSYNWTSIRTTGVAYDIVAEASSGIDNVSARHEGHPWEFLAGLDHPGQGPVTYGHPKWNAYVTYATSWSQHNVATDLGPVDLLAAETAKLVREDVVFADADCNENVNILDILVAAVAFGAEEEGLGPDGLPGTSDDKTAPDPNFDARADMTGDGLINILDILAMSVDFGKQITPQCVIRP